MSENILNTEDIETLIVVMFSKDPICSLRRFLFLFYTIIYQQRSLHQLFSLQGNCFTAAAHLNISYASAVYVLWQIKWFSSRLILLSSAPQRALSPRVPASVSLCLEASNNCSSPPPSLFVSYRGSSPYVLPVPLCLVGMGSSGLNVMRLQQCRRVQTLNLLRLLKRTVVTFQLLSR